MIQVRLNAPVRNIRIDNGTEFVNQTLRSYYESVGISHETSVARSPQQNGVAERLLGLKDFLMILELLLLSYYYSKIKTAERVSTVRERIKTEERIKIVWRSRLLT
ncbi:putative ribonuclease H-like domain-containing protein, partial [Tanacetum coccineum]